MEKYIVESAKVGNLQVNVYFDEGGGITNPAKEGYLFGTFSLYHNRYNLSSHENEFSEFKELQEYLKTGKAIYLPVFMYEHSGITISTGSFSCSWDSGQIGYIHQSKEQIRKEYNCKNITKKILAKVYENLENSVNVYDSYLRGEVFYYEVFEINDNDILSSVCGFLGDSEYCLNEGINDAKYILEQRETDRLQKANNDIETLKIMHY